MKKVLLTILFILIFSFLAHGGAVTLAWDANTESDLLGYKIYWGEISGTYSDEIDVGNQTTYTVIGLG